MIVCEPMLPPYVNINCAMTLVSEGSEADVISETERLSTIESMTLLPHFNQLHVFTSLYYFALLCYTARSWWTYIKYFPIIFVVAALVLG